MPGEFYLLLMKKIKYCFLSLILFFGLKSISVAQSSYQVSAVAFYNLENLFDTINDPTTNDEEFLPQGTKRYTDKVFREKLGQLSSVLGQLGTGVTPDGPAIIGVAEVENRYVLEELVKEKAIAARNYQIEHYDSPDARGVDVGLLYNPRYFTVTYSEPLTVTLTDDKGNPRYATRDVLYVSGLLCGEPTHVFVNHWPSRRGGQEASDPSRRQAAQVCRTRIDSIQKADPDARIIVMGDLNDDPTNASVTKVLNAGGKANALQDGQLFNPFYSLYKKGIGSLAWNDSWNLFDQIIVSQGFLKPESDKNWFYKKAEVFNQLFLTQKSGNFKGYPWRTYIGDEYVGGYSDHFPTIIYLYRLK